MKIKNIFLVISLVFCFMQASAQLRHSIGLSTTIYANFFNQEKEPWGPMRIYKEGQALPEISYTIQKNKHKLELYFNYYKRNYRPITNETLSEEQIASIAFLAFGLNYMYNVYTSKYFTINSFGGLFYGKYHGYQLDHWGSGYVPIYNVPVFKEGGIFNIVGLQAGVNIQAPIWKGIYASSNIRFNTIPWAKNSIYQNNLLVNVGLGYQFGNKK